MTPKETRKKVETQPLEPDQETTRRRQVAPAVDIYEEENALVLVADVPGVAKDSVTAEVKAGVLTIEGRAEEQRAGETVVYSEYEPADFARSFALGESINPAGISASLRNGVLTVRLPKAEQAQSRKITITGE